MANMAEQNMNFEALVSQIQSITYPQLGNDIGNFLLNLPIGQSLISQFALHIQISQSLTDQFPPIAQSVIAQSESIWQSPIAKFKGVAPDKLFNRFTYTLLPGNE